MAPGGGCDEWDVEDGEGTTVNESVIPEEGLAARMLKENEDVAVEEMGTVWAAANNSEGGWRRGIEGRG